MENFNFWWVMLFVAVLCVQWKFLQTAVRSGTLDAMRKLKEEENKSVEKLDVEFLKK